MSRLGGYNLLIESSELYKQGYQVMWLIANSLLNGGTGSPIAEHWITLESAVDENMFAFQGPQGQNMSGVTFTIFNPAAHEKHKVPRSGGYITLNQAVNNFYGFVRRA